MIARLNSRVTCTLRAAAIAAVCVVLAFAYATAVAAPGGPNAGPAGLVTATRFAGMDRGVAEQLANSFAAGDFYVTQRRIRTLNRLAGAVAVRFQDAVDTTAIVKQLTAAGGPLGGYSPDVEYGKAMAILRATEAERSRQVARPSVLTDTLALARRSAGVESADPLFVDPDNGLWLALTGEIIICLKPGVAPRGYFGAEWGNVRPLGGTTDQFVLTIRNVTAEQILAETNRRAAQNAVAWAEPNFLGQAILHLTPNDPYYTSQWHLNNTGQGGGTVDADADVPEAWDTTTGNSGIIVAVLDVGTQTNHPDLSANLAINGGEIAGNSVDDDNNGYVDDVNGWDFYTSYPPGNKDPNPRTYDNHGTAVTGVAVARGNNGTGVAGAAYVCKFLPVRVMNTNSNGTVSMNYAGMTEAIYYAAGRTKNGLGTWRGADILSLSLGFSQTAELDAAFNWAANNGRGGLGCPIFISTGNSAAGWMQFTLSGFPAGTYTFKWEYTKDNVFSAGNDTVWLDSVTFPGGEIERFESGIPSGWVTGGNQNWYGVQDGVSGNHAVTGWNGPGSRAVRAGPITHSQTTYLQASKTVGAGNWVFWAWYSCETNFDFFNVYVGATRYWHVSGVPTIQTSISYPSSHPNVIAVGASTNFDYRSDYSQYGTGLKLVAPSSGGSRGIYTTDRTGTVGYNTVASPAGDYYDSFGGTSSACPFAAGIGALILSRNDDLTSLDVLNIMRGTCDKIGGVTYDANGWNQYYGYGRVNANAALAATGPHGSTAVEIASFDARQYGGAVLLDWRTGYEVNNLGFHVYREDGGRMTRLTEQMVAGSAFLAGAGTNLTAGASYSWWDVAARGSEPARYWLEDVDLSGKRTRHGPVTAVASARPLPLKGRALLLSQLGRVAGGTAQRIQTLESKLRNRPITVRSGSAKPLALSSRRLVKSAVRQAVAPSQTEAQWWLAGQGAVKLSVHKDGWYQVGQPELVAAGLDPSINPQYLHLYADGQEQPLFMADGDRRFEPSDAVEFYGTGQDTPWTDARTYWLVAGPKRGRRIPVVQARSDQASGPQCFLFTVERKDRVVYFPALKNGEADNFFGPIVSTQGADQLLTAPHPASSPPGDATLEVALQGATAGPHRVLVLFNDVEVGTITFNGQEHPVAAVSIPQAALLEGDNLVRLVAQGGETDVSVVDCVRLTYWHSYTADNDSLRCTAPGGQTVTVDGFSGAAISVVDITQPSAPRKMIGTVRPSGTSYAVTVRAPAGGQRTLLALAENAIGSPAAIQANRPSTWHAAGQGTDVAILSNGAFLSSLGPLKALRESQGRSVALIDVEDLYDEFNFGSKSPWALRDFLERTQTQWQTAPRFVLLAGDAGVDPRNYLGLGEADFVPTKLVDTTHLETASDDWFVDLNDDGLPEMAIGRLPVRTTAEAAAAVAKIVAYEQAAPGDWATKVLLVADNNDVFDFEGASAAVAGLLPASLTADGVFLGWTSITLARSMLMQKLNAGRLLVNYIGHGSLDTWAAEELLTNADAAALTNSPRLPFVISMTCLNGFLHDPYTDSLAEALLKAERGGAIAVWASSGLTEPTGQAAMDKELIRLLFGGPSPTIGEATARAKAAAPDQDIRRTWILFGDPALRLK